MEILKCKTCGSPIDPTKAKGGVVECEYCHNKLTLPKIGSSAESAVFQGSLELDVCDFDRAYTVFKRASELDKTEPEAYFGMALAEFKVQYLTDANKRKLQPICHDVSGKVFTDSANYKKALDLATPDQRAEYEQKGKEIDYIRKEFYALKSAGEGYDTFLCVKVSGDEPGRKTEDSDRASQLYYHLRDKGFRPFYSEREIQNQTGADYEARILYALFTSGSMIVVCSNEEYLQTPWVKNEYTRFLRLINNDEKERDAITIAFHGTPVERLPGKDGRIQGVNLASPDAYSKLDEFVAAHITAETPELIRKVYGQNTYKKKDAIKSQVQKRALATYAKSEVTVSERGKLEIARTMLQSRSFDAVTNRCKDIIATNPSCSEAYWMLFLAENGCTDAQQFISSSKHVDSFANLESAIASGTPEQNEDYYRALRMRTKNEKALYLYQEFISLPDSSVKDISDLTKTFYEIASKGDMSFSAARKIFDEIIKTVTNTDKFIKMNMGFADAYVDKGVVAVRDYYKAILDADAANYEAQFKFFVSDKNITADGALEGYFTNPENHAEIESRMYEYGYNGYATDILMELCHEIVKSNTTGAVGLFSYLCTLVPDEQNEFLAEHLERFVYELITCGSFENARRFNDQLAGIDKFNYEAYFNRLLINRRINNALWLINDCDGLYDDPDYALAIDAYAEKQVGTQNIYITIANELKETKNTLRSYNYPFGLEALTQEETGRGCDKILDAIKKAPARAKVIYENLLTQQKEAAAAKSEKRKKQASKAKAHVLAVLFGLPVAALFVLIALAAYKPTLVFGFLPYGWMIVLYIVAPVGFFFLFNKVRPLFRWQRIAGYVGCILCLGGMIACLSTIGIRTVHLSKANDVLAIANMPCAKEYVLDNDIDMEELRLKPGPKLKTDCVFDGNGHTLRNITLERVKKGAFFFESHGYVRGGLFAECDGTVKNLTISNCRLLSDDTMTQSGDYKVGTLVGHLSYPGKITNCTLVNCEIGFVGENDYESGGNITGCSRR